MSQPNRYNSYDHLFLKGFRVKESKKLLDTPPAEGAFEAVISNNLVSTYYLEVTSAHKEAGNTGRWTLHIAGGEVATLAEEPKEPRSLFGYSVSLQKLEVGFQLIAKKEVENTSEFYVRQTSRIVKYWLDDEGVSHAVTQTGSHYIFK